MKREVSLVLILGCILILVLEAPAALSSVTADIGEPYAPWEALPTDVSTPDGSAPPAPALEREAPTEPRQE